MSTLSVKLLPSFYFRFQEFLDQPSHVVSLFPSGSAESNQPALKTTSTWVTPQRSSSGFADITALINIKLNCL